MYEWAKKRLVELNLANQEVIKDGDYYVVVKAGELSNWPHCYPGFARNCLAILDGDNVAGRVVDAPRMIVWETTTPGLLKVLVTDGGTDHTNGDYYAMICCRNEGQEETAWWGAYSGLDWLCRHYVLGMFNCIRAMQEAHAWYVTKMQEAKENSR